MNFRSIILSGFRAAAFLTLLLFVGIASRAQAQETWVNQDIGWASEGSSVYDSGTGQFTVKGSGTDIWGSGDNFQFVHVPVGTKNVIVAKVESVQNTHAWAKAGVMIRESTNANSRNAMLLVSPENGVSFQRRRDNPGSTVNTAIGGSPRRCG
jgi:hypothetical protein